VSNPADAENARVAELLQSRLLDRQARFGGRLTTARELQVGDTFLDGAGGPGGDTPERVAFVKIKPGRVHGDTVIYRTQYRSTWISAAQGVLILPYEP
jgi:hypothetical protein